MSRRFPSRRSIAYRMPGAARASTPTFSSRPATVQLVVGDGRDPQVALEAAACAEAAGPAGISTTT